MSKVWLSEFVCFTGLSRKDVSGSFSWKTSTTSLFAG